MIVHHVRDELDPHCGGESDESADRLLRYGLDARMRSGLRACFRGAEGVDARAQRAREMLATLTAADPHSTSDSSALQAFLDLFAALPDADFSVEWLERLAESWKELRHAGCAEDMPSRAAQSLVVIGSRQLMGERSTLSALEVEIVAALSAGGLYVADFLLRVGRQGLGAGLIDANVPTDRDNVLSRQLATVLDQASGGIVGLMVLRLRLLSGALTLDREERDALVNAAMQRIRGVLREADIVVRTEAHAWSVIMPNLQTHAQVQLAAARVAQAFEQPLPVRGKLVRAAFSLGAVWSPDHGTGAGELIRCVDIAVEAARREERSVVLFDESMLSVARREAQIEKEFVAAMENGQMAIHIQPQIDLSDGQCVGGELLLRWTNSDGNAVPSALIPEVAQRIGAGAQLTRWLVFGACRTLSELNKAGVDIQLSVNLMARDLMDRELPLLVDQAIRFWRVPPEKLMFELIESAVLEDPSVGATVMNELIDLGVSTSIDDFGIGYSSILYLRRLPLDELKIDRAFVDAMFRAREDKEIVATLIGLAHGLGLQVVAEGVENEETLQLLRDMGCDRAQGFWISRAIPPGEFPAWFGNWNSQRARGG